MFLDIYLDVYKMALLASRRPMRALASDAASHEENSHRNKHQCCMQHHRSTNETSRLKYCSISKLCVQHPTLKTNETSRHNNCNISKSCLRHHNDATGFRGGKGTAVTGFKARLRRPVLRARWPRARRCPRGAHRQPRAPPPRSSLARLRAPPAQGL